MPGRGAALANVGYDFSGALLALQARAYGQQVTPAAFEKRKLTRVFAIQNLHAAKLDFDEIEQGFH